MTKNIILTGMPGVGKSTVGVILAKELGYQFVDSDLLIQEQEGRLLKTIIEEEGLEGFLRIENDVNMSIKGQRKVVATGGSAVYSHEAMEAFHRDHLVLYLHCPYSVLEKRLSDLKGRGVVLKEGQTLKELYMERTPLYEYYAHLTVEEGHGGIEETLSKVIRALKDYDVTGGGLGKGTRRR